MRQRSWRGAREGREIETCSDTRWRVPLSICITEQGRHGPQCGLRSDSGQHHFVSHLPPMSREESYDATRETVRDVRPTLPARVSLPNASLRTMNVSHKCFRQSPQYRTLRLGSHRNWQAVPHAQSGPPAHGHRTPWARSQPAPENTPAFSCTPSPPPPPPPPSRAPPHRVHTSDQARGCDQASSRRSASRSPPRRSWWRRTGPSRAQRAVLSESRLCNTRFLGGHLGRKKRGWTPRAGRAKVPSVRRQECRSGDPAAWVDDNSPLLQPRLTISGNKRLMRTATADQLATPATRRRVCFRRAT